MKKKVTSTDIAKAAGVSQSTVSMVLNKKYNVSFSRETIDKVEHAAKELGYVPPKRKTKKGVKKEKLLVVFCSNLTNPYYVMLLQASCEGAGLRTFCVQHPAGFENGGAVSENDVGASSIGNHLYL